MKEQNRPLVTVCVPVRNGARTLERALNTLRNQTYANLEILLSDNQSSDDTPQIMGAFAAADPRARYIRHDIALPVLEHFGRLVQLARGKYTLFCADDDERNEICVEALVESLEREPDAVLGFGRLVIVGEDGSRRETPFHFENDSLTCWRRVSRSAWLQCFHFYGLWRTSVLKKIKIRETTYWPDMQVMMAANCHGTFVRDERALFLYHEKAKSNRERAMYQSYKVPSPLFRLTMFTTSVAAILEAGGGPRIAAWAVSNLTLREMLAAITVVRRRLRQR